MRKFTYILGALLLASIAVFAFGCSESADEYNVYEVSKYKDQGIMEYDVVYYEPNGSSSLNDILTGYVDESHYEKAQWTEDEVKQSTAKAYPDIDSMDFVTTSLTDEGDYYCSIVEFKDLDKLDNLTTLYQHGTLLTQGFSIAGAEPDPNAKADKQVGASMFRSSLGGTEVQGEDEIEKLGMHYFAAKGQ